jgi:hypothetical protein
MIHVQFVPDLFYVHRREKFCFRFQKSKGIGIMKTPNTVYRLASDMSRISLRYSGVNPR